MTLDQTKCGDSLSAASGYQRGDDPDCAVMRGHGVAQVYGPDGELKQTVSFTNLITQVGEQLYGERGAGITTLATPTGMQLGTGTTAPAKTGSGSSIGTLVAGSLMPLNGTPSSSIPSSIRRITYATTWAAGSATANGISEVVLVNQATGTQTAAPASATLARALLSPSVNKSSADSLTVTWHHDVGTA